MLTDAKGKEYSDVKDCGRESCPTSSAKPGPVGEMCSTVRVIDKDKQVHINKLDCLSESCPKSSMYREPPPPPKK